MTQLIRPAVADLAQTMEAACLHELFQMQADERPAQLAMVCGENYPNILRDRGNTLFRELYRRTVHYLLDRSGATEGTPKSLDGKSTRIGAVRGVAFTAITEDWRLRGQMQIAGRLTDALNRREAIAISDVTWGPADGTGAIR